MKLSRYLIVGSALALAGCGSITLPAKGTLGDVTMTGTTTASVSGGTFELTNGQNTCSGTYDPFDTAKRITVNFTCTDGRTGTADIARDPDGMGGIGVAKLSDGSTGTVAFGKKHVQ